MLDGKTSLVGVMGWPVAHSISPAMHNAAFEYLGMNWCYVPLPVQPQNLSAAMKGLPALGFRGVNVTIPHKQAVLPSLTHLDPSAGQIGAANTIVIQSPTEASPIQMTGYNTDAYGFLAALRTAGFSMNDKSAPLVIVGAGGSARAVVWALLNQGFDNICLLTRTLEHAQQLVSNLGDTIIKTLPYSMDNLVDITRHAALLVNTTPLGMWPEIDASIWPVSAALPRNIIVFDLVYNPLKTKLMIQAEKSGATAIGGLEMLVQQGVQAFELWTGKSAPFTIMHEACLQKLR